MTEMPVARVMLGLVTLTAVVCCVASSESAQAQPRARVFHSRPDLRPPPVQILVRTRHVTPGYIFIAPKKRVAQAGPLILDNRGRVVWFLPLDAR